MYLRRMLCSGGLQQPGSSEWRVAEKNRQRGNDRLLHNTSEMESTMWRQPVERNHRRLQGVGLDNDICACWDTLQHFKNVILFIIYRSELAFLVYTYLL